MARGDPPAKRIIRMSTNQSGTRPVHPKGSKAAVRTAKHFKPAKHAAAVKKAATK